MPALGEFSGLATNSTIARACASALQESAAGNGDGRVRAQTLGGGGGRKMGGERGRSFGGRGGPAAPTPPQRLTTRIAASPPRRTLGIVSISPALRTGGCRIPWLIHSCLLSCNAWWINVNRTRSGEYRRSIAPQR